MTTEESASKEDMLSHKMSTNHIRVAVVGNVDAGKSTLIGTLKSGSLDNGRGHSRGLIVKHKHEIETGRTSTITSHLLGYDENGRTINHGPNSDSTARIQIKGEDEVAVEANKLVSLVDLAGHEKYLKTTIQGVTSGMIDYALVLVNANHPPTHMTCHHISLAVAFGIPLVIVLTKTDGCPKHALKHTKEEISNILRSPGVQRKPFQIKQESDIIIVKDKMHAVAPVISVSSVTGEGLNLLNAFLFALPKRRRHQNKIGRGFEFLLEDTYNVTGVGSVVSGFVNAGKARVGTTAFVGPLDNGSFLKTVIKSAHIARTHVSEVMAGNSACLALSLSKDERKLLRKGMVVLEKPAEATRVFEAELVVIKGSGVDGTTIKKGYETVAHILHVRQTVKIENIELVEDGSSFGGSSTMFEDNESGVVIRPGDRAKVTFRFLKRNEFLRKGMRIVFRDGHIRGCGIVTTTDVV